MVETDAAKRKKLSILLRTQTNNALASEELRQLLLRISPHRQYALHIYTEPDCFCAELVLAKNKEDDDRGKIILGRASFGCSERNTDGVLFADDVNAAAVVHRKKRNSPTTTHELHIYIPEKSFRKDSCERNE